MRGVVPPSARIRPNRPPAASLGHPDRCVAADGAKHAGDAAGAGREGIEHRNAIEPGAAHLAIEPGAAHLGIEQVLFTSVARRSGRCGPGAGVLERGRLARPGRARQPCGAGRVARRAGAMDACTSHACNRGCAALAVSRSCLCRLSSTARRGGPHAAVTLMQAGLPLARERSIAPYISSDFPPTLLHGRRARRQPGRSVRVSSSPAHGAVADHIDRLRVMLSAFQRESGCRPRRRTAACGAPCAVSNSAM